MSRPRVVTLVANHKRLAVTVVILAILGIIVPQLADFRQSLHLLSQVSWPYLAAAIGLTFMVYLLLAELYHTLVKKPVTLRSLQLVQFATGVASRLAPIGVGTIGLNLLFLRRKDHTVPQALAVAAAANIILLTMHFAILGIVALSVPLPHHLHLNISRRSIEITGLAIGLVLVSLIVFRPIRRRIVRAVIHTFEALSSYRDQPRKLIVAATFAAVQSSTYVFGLMACALALHTSIPFNQAFVIYTFSLLLGAAVATPGGLVGVEAGLAGGFVAYGVNTDTALAIALLYRLVTYWLPILPGLIALRIVQRRYF